MQREEPSLHFEFRIFGEALESCGAAVSACGVGTVPEVRKDIYLLAPGKDAVDVKLGEGRLEVKMLEAREAGVEVWRTTLAAALPVAASKFISEAGNPLAISFDVPPTAVLDAEDIVQLAKLESRVVVVEVDKRWRRHAVDGGHCEVVDLRVGEVGKRSFAIESSKREVVERLIRRFKISPDANQGYPAFLLRHAG